MDQAQEKNKNKKQEEIKGENVGIDLLARSNDRARPLMRPDWGRPVRYGWWTLSHSAIKGRWDPVVRLSRLQLHKNPTDSPDPSDHKGALVQTGSSTGVILRRRVVLSRCCRGQPAITDPASTRSSDSTPTVSVYSFTPFSFMY